MAGGDTVAGVIARFLDARGVGTVFALQGGHIQPIWDRAVTLGVRFVDVRDERAAVHMAHAHGELACAPGVAPGVAMVTAGPGTVNEEPQPQVVAAFGLRITNCAPERSSV